MVIKAIWHLLRIAVFDFGTRRSFRDYMVAFAWLIAIAALYVSMPHTAEVLHSYEGGDETNKALKAWSMTLIVELTAGALFLIALHSKGLSDEQRKNIATFSVPFYVLTGEIQAAYFFHITDWDWVKFVIAAQLSLVLPYCTFVAINIIGYLLSTSPQLAAAVKACTNLKIFGFSIVEAREVGQELNAAQAEITRLHAEVANLHEQLVTQVQPVTPVQTITIKDEQAERRVLELASQVANLTRTLEDSEAELARIATTSRECGHETVLVEANRYLSQLENEKAQAVAEVEAAKREADTLAKANRPLLTKVHELEQQLSKLSAANLKSPAYPAELVRKKIGLLFTKDAAVKLNSDSLTTVLGEIWEEKWREAVVTK